MNNMKTPNVKDGASIGRKAKDLVASISSSSSIMTLLFINASVKGTSWGYLYTSTYILPTYLVPSIRGKEGVNSLGILKLYPK